MPLRPGDSLGSSCPDQDGYAELIVDELCPSTWYSYVYFVGDPQALSACRDRERGYASAWQSY